jgi:hypothetical protein
MKKLTSVIVIMIVFLFVSGSQGKAGPYVWPPKPGAVKVYDAKQFLGILLDIKNAVPYYGNNADVLSIFIPSLGAITWIYLQNGDIACCPKVGFVDNCFGDPYMSYRNELGSNILCALGYGENRKYYYATPPRIDSYILINSIINEGPNYTDCGTGICQDLTESASWSAGGYYQAVSTPKEEVPIDFPIELPLRFKYK